MMSKKQNKWSDKPLAIRREQWPMIEKAAILYQARIDRAMSPQEFARLIIDERCKLEIKRGR